MIQCFHQMMGGSMVLPLSMDIRARVAMALEDGERVRAAAKRFGVSVASAVRIGQRQRAGRGQVRPKVARFGARWRAHQHRLDPRRLISIDKTWIKTNMTLTFLAGLRHDRIVAPFVLDGPINRDAFTAWVGQCLAPALAPGDIVIADNLGSHKGLPARQLIRNAGAHLPFLPPCRPDLNPIEMVFAKLKTLFRKADERAVEDS